ncbi:MAG TPA: DUF1499 domain-containing protein [Gemmataceae bacterium]|nr:DUF1499 domain-containing protein [Gemmataceae bacterium]
MSLLHWFTRNWADTDEPGDPALAPVDLPLSPPDALGRVTAAVRGLPRWAVASEDAAAGTLHATRRTRLWRFVDDIHVRLEPLPDGTTRLHARSKSRVGVGDFGQNRRNLLELFGALNGS